MDHPFQASARRRYLEQVAVARQRETSFRAAGDQPVKRVVIVESDRFYGDTLLSLAQSVFAGAAVIRVATIGAADAEIRRRGAELVLSVPIVSGDDVLEYLARWHEATGCRILLIASQPPAALLADMSERPIAGIFDRSSGATQDLAGALLDVSRGVRYYSQGVLERLFTECVSRTSVYGSLTVTERMVLGVIGDGCDDKVAADRLSMTPLGVKSMRRQLHRKLGVQHRGELQQRALTLGFVIATPSGFVRPGLATLLAARLLAKNQPPPKPTSTQHAA